MQSNEIKPDLSFIGASSSTAMKISGLIPDFYHKDCTHCLSGLLEVLVSHATYILSSDIVIPDFPGHSSLKISPPEFTPILTTLWLYCWVLWNIPSQANFKVHLCHHTSFQL